MLICQTEEYQDLPWKLSQKNSALSTIRITEIMPQKAKQLYNELLRVRNQRIKLIGGITYRLSRDNSTNTEFLQRWDEKKDAIRQREHTIIQEYCPYP